MIHVIDDVVLDDRKLGLIDSLVRCLHKGKTEEQAAAAVCAVLLAIQLGAPDEEFYNLIAPPLKVVLSDDSASYEARAAVSTLIAPPLKVVLSDDSASTKTRAGVSTYQSMSNMTPPPLRLEQV